MRVVTNQLNTCNHPELRHTTVATDPFDDDVSLTQIFASFSSAARSHDVAIEVAVIVVVAIVIIIRLSTDKRTCVFVHNPNSSRHIIHVVATVLLVG